MTLSGATSTRCNTRCNTAQYRPTISPRFHLPLRMLPGTVNKRVKDVFPVFLFAAFVCAFLRLTFGRQYQVLELPKLFVCETRCPKNSDVMRCTSLNMSGAHCLHLSTSHVILRVQIQKTKNSVLYNSRCVPHTESPPERTGNSDDRGIQRHLRSHSTMRVPVTTTYKNF